MTWAIDDWLVDPDSNTLMRGHEVRKLEPRTMAVLRYLAERPGTVIGREELEREIWRGRVVGYDALGNTIVKIRRAFNDDARHPRVIETIHKTGYRLISSALPVGQNSVARSPSPEQAESLPFDAPYPALPSRPSIAVLAFENMGGSTIQDYLGDGLAEDIITGLSKLPDLFVIARNSSFVYKGQRVEPRRLCRQLGVRYVLEGSVRVSGEHTRITARLVEGETADPVWVERYDRQRLDILELQDEISRRIVRSLVPALVPDRNGPTSKIHGIDAGAYDCFLRARELDRRDTKIDNAAACDLFEQAIALAPGFSLAFSGLSRNRAVNHANNWDQTETDLMRLALDYARQACELDESNPHAHFAMAAAALWLHKHDLARIESDRSIRLDPNFAEGHAVRGMILVYCGEPERAIGVMETAMRLDPHYRNVYLHIIAQAFFHSGQFELAVKALQRRLTRKPDSDISRALLAATYGHLGLEKEARAQWTALLEINPEYSLAYRRKILPYRDPADFEFILAGLRSAGLVE